MKYKEFKLSAAGNTEPPAYYLVKEKGFEISKSGDFYVAENSTAQFVADSPLQLLGLIALYEAKGKNWRVSDEKIDEFVQFDCT